MYSPREHVRAGPWSALGAFAECTRTWSMRRARAEHARTQRERSASQGVPRGAGALSPIPAKREKVTFICYLATAWLKAMHHAQAPRRPGGNPGGLHLLGVLGLWECPLSRPHIVPCPVSGVGQADKPKLKRELGWMVVLLY